MPKKPEQDRLFRVVVDDTEEKNAAPEEDFSADVAEMRAELIAAGAPDELLQLLDGADGPDELMQRMQRSGFLPTPEQMGTDLLEQWEPLLERGATALDAELCGLEFLALFNTMAQGDLAPLIGLIQQVALTGTPEALAMALSLKAVGPPRIQAATGDAIEVLRAAGRTDPAWAKQLATPKVGRCFGYGDGLQESVAMTFSYGRRSHVVLVLIDHGLGGGIKDCFVAEDERELRAEATSAARSSGVPLEDYEPERAQAILSAALAEPPCPVEPDQIEDVETYLDLIRSRVALLPTGSPALPGPTARKSTARKSRARKSASAAPGKPGTVHRMKVTLSGSKPPIWRRLEVPSHASLQQLHDIIQTAFGWTNSHLWSFSTGTGEYGPSELEGRNDPAGRNLAEVAGSPGDRLSYLYDFGDGWEHDIRVEEILAPGPRAAGPRCTGGRRACPPEDCGGIWGYAGLIETLSDPRHEDHSDLLEWLGLDSADAFDPAAFDLESVNAWLSGR